MRPEQVYAVVDIEATGGSVGADERVIQFACALVQNGEVINTFETLVNPGRNIPRNITQLTNISDKDVGKAPYFEEIAPTILNLLDDTIFVAHNVGFDYRFLNEQLKLHDFEPINIPAIDTVELTQILYPSLDSFQLEDIAAYLGYKLVDAHDALADVEATVYIFKQLFKKAYKLPLVTLEKLNELAACTTHETARFFQTALEYALTLKNPLSEELVVVNQIAMQKPSQLSTGNQFGKPYPKTEESKKSYFNINHSYRKVQAEMMDLIYDYFMSDLSLEKLAIEAPSGIGKSLGYLFPASFTSLSNNEPIIISTYTTILQDQLIQETLPELENILGREINATLIKSSNHYISLSLFGRWLNTVTYHDSEAYLIMRILVWLTETKTGDFSEINAGSHLDLAFWQEIRASKNDFIDDHWRAYDFYNRIKESAKNVEIIITNHHFLVSDWQETTPIIPKLEYVILDEAHHFPEVAVRSNVTKLSAYKINNQLNKLGSISNNTGIYELINDLFNHGKIKTYDLKGLERTRQTLIEIWDSLLTDLSTYFEDTEPQIVKDTNYAEQEFSLDIFDLNQKMLIKNILRTAEEFVFTIQQIIKSAYDIFEELSTENQIHLIELGKIRDKVSDWAKKIDDIFTETKDSTESLRWVTYRPEDIRGTLQFNRLRWGENNSFIDYLATHSKVVFTSSTLSFNNSQDYFSEQLKNLPMQFYQLDSPFDYGKQVRIMLPEERINPKKIKKGEYAEQLATIIGSVLSQTNKNSVVLFRSLAVLEEVYEALINDERLNDHLILAQAISGTRNRILKNFKRHEPAVILGVDSFFEGIDLPDEELELLILTRLPFPAPNAPLTRLKTDFLKKQGVHPFIGEYLPQAVLKFEQAFGRLIRNQSDQGVMVVLDDRFISASYSKVFKDSLPQGVPIEVYENEELGKRIQDFLERDK